MGGDHAGSLLNCILLRKLLLQLIHDFIYQASLVRMYAQGSVDLP